MKANINTQEVKVYRIRIDYIKHGHEGVQLLNAWNKNPRSLFIQIFGRCSTQLLALSHAPP